MSKVKYVLLRLMASDYSFGILKPFVRGIHVPRSLVFCVMFCRSLYVLLCPFLLAIVSYVLLRLMASDYSFGILKPFFRVIHVLSYFYCLISFGHCIVFHQYFSYIVAVSFIAEGNQSIGRKQQTCHKSLINFMT